MKIEIIKDSDADMLQIVVNGTSFFYGNYWDFSVPKDIEALISFMSSKSDIELEVRKGSLEDEALD